MNDNNNQSNKSDNELDDKMKKREDFIKNNVVPKVHLIKIILQFGIGAFIIIFTVIKIIRLSFNFTPPSFLNYYFNMPFLTMISKGLLASTAIDLGYMLFTPGQDEAVNPIITGIAAGILTILSEDVPNFKDSIGIGILVLAIAILFWVKEKYIDINEEK